MYIPEYPQFSPRAAMSALGCFMIAALTLGASGCNDAQLGRDVAGSRNNEDSDEVLRIDLGCIQRGSKVEFCIPLEKLRIASHAEIDSIKSSCECIGSKQVSFRSGMKEERDDGLLISIHSVYAPAEPPISLRVKIEIVLLDGCVRSVEVCFIETDFSLVKRFQFFALQSRIRAGSSAENGDDF